MRVLLLGLGRWGINHLRVLKSLPIELYIAEPDSPRLEEARQLGVPDARLATAHHDALEQVDCAVVVTPVQTHVPLCTELLRAGKDVFVEKPMALTCEEARALAELAEAEERILQVGHIFRFDPASQWLRDAVQSGRFGQVHMLRGTFTGFKRPRTDSGVMFADAIHFADLFNYFMGASPVRVSATTQDFLGRGMEDASFMSLEYRANGKSVWATVEANYFVPGKLREVAVVGSELSARCDYNAARYKIRTFANRHICQADGFTAVEGVVQQIESPPEEPLLAELRAFLHSVRTRETPRADGWVGYESVRLIEAATTSAETRRVVELNCESWT